jgi:hypothetical protein
MELVEVWMTHKMTSLTNINVKLSNKTNMKSITIQIAEYMSNAATVMERQCNFDEIGDWKC